MVIFIRIGGIQSGLSVQWILLTCIYIRSKLGSYHALFWDGSHSGTDVCVVDWFSSMYVTWIPVANIHDKLLFFRRVYSKSITALLDY